MSIIATEVAKLLTYKCLSNIISTTDYNSDKLKHDEDNIITRIKVISKIEYGYQFDITNYKMQPYNWWTSFERRVLRPNDRSDTINFIRNAINDAFLLLKLKLTDPNEKDLCEKIINDIISCKKGIFNLSRHPRYKLDICFISELETLIDKIDTISQYIRNEYPMIRISATTTHNTPNDNNTPSLLSPRTRSQSLI